MLYELLTLQWQRNVFQFHSFQLFLSSNVDENQCLNADGLFLLCEKLKLSAFAKSITEKVLCGAEVVDFYDFKDRFVSYLPEIIDVSSGAVDPLLARAQETARTLGYGEGQRLTRYETRLLCENTEDLVQLSVVDINGLFERADVERTGRVSIQQFLAQYRLQKRLSAEVHFIADSFVSSLNLFEALDSANSGTIDSHDLLEYWNKAGLRIDEGLAVLEESGQPVSGNINAVYLSGFLERELSRSTSEAPVSVKAAIIALHCCIDNLRCMVREGESRAEHLHKQLQQANQRRTLLIEELEHNQISIEQGYEARLRETEERYRARYMQMEDKFRLDKREIQNEVEQLEEELSRVRQVETSAKNKAMLLERQNSRLLEETREQSESISQLEQINRQLRNELSKSIRSAEDNTQLIMYKQKLEIVVAHNKRLREKIQELSVSQKKKSRVNDGEPFSLKWSNAFRSQVMLIRKRRLAKGDTLSEMESEPESIFVRHRRRKLLKRKERKLRHERTASRILMQDSDDTESSKGGGKSARSELIRLRNEHKQELMAVRQTAAKTLAEALNDQQKQLNLQLERERRQWEVRSVSEKNQLEKNFAEEKMKLMNRLQEDFDAELERISSIVNRPENGTAAEHYKRQIKTLESSLESQKKSYERRLAELRDRFKSSLRSHNNVYLSESNTPNFFSLVEKYKNAGASASKSEPYVTSRSSLSVEKRSPPGHPFQRSFTNMVGRCEKCELAEVRLREIYHTVIGDHTLAESGIEDLGSSAGSLADDKIVLKREVRKLKGRLDAAKEKLSELRMLLAMPSSRYKCSLGGSEGNGADLRRMPFRAAEATATIEKLESEKVILEARLSEAQQLIKTLVEQYNTQLDETARVGAVLRDVYMHPNVSPDVCQKTPS
ncbi:hypothetical protein OESDEN_01963 [Oesophagostomum dentatum]|uniref:Uncharacterized protein n=1 Tax=Oesophagostomum dentatum TaxID=61180 RepID=A0A0B1TRN2_OESDE|nr:hypothetical protein OESDEN_01963 [Oesophagostomum dentatum]